MRHEAGVTAAELGTPRCVQNTSSPLRDSPSEGTGVTLRENPDSTAVDNSDLSEGRR